MSYLGWVGLIRDNANTGRRERWDGQRWLDAGPGVLTRAAEAVQAAADPQIADSTGRYAELVTDLVAGDLEKLLDHAGAVSDEEMAAAQRWGAAVVWYAQAARREWGRQ